MIKKTYVDKKCIVCGEMFSRKPMYSIKQWGLAKFCSKKCWSIRGEIQTKKCNFCKKEFSLPANLMRLGHKREKRACSLACAYGLTTAEKSYLWKGEKRPYATRFRTALANTVMYRKWRNEIKKRDDNKCVNCLEGKNKMHVHHIYPLHQIIKEENWSMENFMKLYTSPDSMLWKISNGVTICEDCHNSLISVALQSKGFYPKR